MKRKARKTAPSLKSPLILRRSGRYARLISMLACAATSALGQVLPPAPIRSDPEPYVDRLMEGVMADALDLKPSEYNSEGWPRSIRLDYSLFGQSGPSSTRSQALGVGGFLDTPNHGALSFNANLAQQDTIAGSPATGLSSTWRLDQRGLPLAGGWFANHSAGDINTGRTRLSQGIGRISLPTAPVRGVSGQWLRGDSIDLNASAGRAGLFNGVEVAGFAPTRGQIASAGAQFKLPASFGRSDAAIQFIDGRSISDSGGSTSLQDTRAFWMSTAWEGAFPWGPGLKPSLEPASERQGGLRLQGNLVQSASSRDGPVLGMWGDAAWRDERWRNTAGIFRFEPNLRWGPSVLASDIQGAYWQGDTFTRQWQAGFAFEITDSVSSSGAGSISPGRSLFLNLNGRYSLDSRNAVGAALSMRAISKPGQALLLTWDHTTSWGQTQWRSDLSHTAGSRILRLAVDQSWALALPSSFSTSLAWERSRGTADSSAWIWGLLGNASLYQSWSVDGSLRGARYSDGANSVNANVGLNWQAFDGWSVSLRYTQAQGQEPNQALVVSALTAASLQTIATIPASRSLQLLLRYEGRAGNSTVPLGGVAGSGAGSVAGTVFFDTDNNGKREASEGGVPGVTVILDRRYVTRTDAQGRYEFPFVAAQGHLIEISSDNVPLPWSPLLRDPAKIDVMVRETTLHDFAVQRDR